MITYTLNPNVILLKWKDIKSDSLKKGVLYLPGQNDIPKGQEGATTSTRTEYGVWLEIAQIGSNVEKDVPADKKLYKVGQRVILMEAPSQWEYLRTFDAGSYTLGKDPNRYILIDPKQIALIINYDYKEVKPEASGKGDPSAETRDKAFETEAAKKLVNRSHVKSGGKFYPAK